MRVLVDLTRCQFYAQCCFLAPNVFKLVSEEVLSYHPSPQASERDCVLRAASACPTLAITIEPDGLEKAP